MLEKNLNQFTQIFLSLLSVIKEVRYINQYSSSDQWTKGFIWKRFEKFSLQWLKNLHAPFRSLMQFLKILDRKNLPMISSKLDKQLQPRNMRNHPNNRYSQVCNRFCECSKLNTSSGFLTPVSRTSLEMDGTLHIISSFQKPYEVGSITTQAHLWAWGRGDCSRLVLTKFWQPS